MWGNFFKNTVAHNFIEAQELPKCHLRQLVLVAEGDNSLVPQTKNTISMKVVGARRKHPRHRIV